MGCNGHGAITPWLDAVYSGSTLKLLLAQDVYRAVKPAQIRSLLG
jgi:hypothetical protein